MLRLFGVCGRVGAGLDVYDGENKAPASLSEVMPALDRMSSVRSEMITSPVG